MTFLDTGILVGLLLEKHPEHKSCEAALQQFSDCFTNFHALAETFATLTGFYKVPTHAAAELTLGLKERIEVKSLSVLDYETAIREARSRGIMGGGIYDSLHATFARREGAKRIVTRNPSHFAHAAPEVGILTP
jgi:predicted nucleic acid-binding protein